MDLHRGTILGLTIKGALMTKRHMYLPHQTKTTKREIGTNRILISPMFALVYELLCDYFTLLRAWFDSLADWDPTAIGTFSCARLPTEGFQRRR
jgi:hypothetical protein